MHAVTIVIAGHYGGKKMTLYIYDADTMQAIDQVEGKTNRECEALAESKGYTDDCYGWAN